LEHCVFVFSRDSKLRNTLMNCEFLGNVRFISDVEILCESLILFSDSIVLFDFKLFSRIGPKSLQEIKTYATYSKCFILSDLPDNTAQVDEGFFCYDTIKVTQNISDLKKNLFEKILFFEKKYLNEKVVEEIYEKELENFIGNSDSIKSIKRSIKNYARTDNPLLLLGESGTGKSYLAQIIHKISLRSNKPFFSLNMASIPISLAEAELFGTTVGAYTDATNREGFLETASDGTLFMDEIGDLPDVIQPKLLHVLEEQVFCRIGSAKTYNCKARFLFATNTNLKQKVANKKFREDLFYRISVLPLEIPPLRERKQDIPIFVEDFLKTVKKNISISGMNKLKNYQWPGNVRELKNCLIRANILSGASEISERHIIF